MLMEKVWTGLALSRPHGGSHYIGKKYMCVCVCCSYKVNRT